MAAREKPKENEAERRRLQVEQDLIKQRKTFVETLAGYGMAADQIGLLLVPPITEDEVKRDFALELEMGPAKANLETVAVLRSAVKKGNVTACIYWTKAQMGWTEKGPTKELPNDLPDDAPAQKMPSANEMGRLLSIPLGPTRRTQGR